MASEPKSLTITPIRRPPGWRRRWFSSVGLAGAEVATDDRQRDRLGQHVCMLPPVQVQASAMRDHGTLDAHQAARSVGDGRGHSPR